MSWLAVSAALSFGSWLWQEPCGLLRLWGLLSPNGGCAGLCLNVSVWVMALPVHRILWKKNEVADYEATTFSIFYNNTLFLVLVIIASFFVLKNFNPTVYPFLPRLEQPRPCSCLLSLVPGFVSWAASGPCRWVWFILVPQLRNTCT